MQIKNYHLFINSDQFNDLKDILRPYAYLLGSWGFFYIDQEANEQVNDHRHPWTWTSRDLQMPY